MLGSLLAGFYLLRVYDIGDRHLRRRRRSTSLVARDRAGRSPRATPYEPTRRSRPPARRRAGAGRVGGLRRDRALGPDGARRRSDLDAPAVAAVRRDGLHLLADPRGVPVRPRHRQQRRLGDRRAASQRPRVALGWCQLLLCGAMAWAAYMLTAVAAVLADQPVDLRPTPWFNFQLDLVRCMWAMLPGAILWGASFPLALAVGRVARPGSGAAGRRRLRRQHRRRDRRRARRQPAAGRLARQPARAAAADRHRRRSRRCSMLDAGRRRETGAARARSSPARCRHRRRGAGAALLARDVPPLPGAARRLRPLRRHARRPGRRSSTSGEGWNASVAVSRLPNGVLNYHNAGKVQASSEPQDMRLQRMLGHLTTLIPTNPKTVLVIGCGAGVTAGAVSIDPAVEHADDRRDRAARAAASSRRYFAEHNFDVVDNPKVHVAHRRRAALPADDRREVRRDHLRSARSVGQGRGDALHRASSSSSSRRT